MQFLFYRVSFIMQNVLELYIYNGSIILPYTSCEMDLFSLYSPTLKDTNLTAEYRGLVTIPKITSVTNV